MQVNTTRKARIVLVDDEPAILNMLSTLLTGAGYTPVAVSRGDSAIAMLREEEFDLLISDLRMSPVDGMQVLAEVRAMRPMMPVMILTGYASDATRKQAAELGAHAYLTKPFQLQELLDTIGQALKRA